METILYVAVSANGLILLTSENNYQVPLELLQDCMGLAHQTGNMVIGLNTYRLFSSNPNALEAFKGVEIAVLSASCKEELEGVTVLKNIDAVMEFYQVKGHSKIFVAGGAYTYQSFLKEGHADEFYINYLPILTAAGALLVSQMPSDKTLELKENKLIAENIVQLHFTTK
ncbi:dihydrofolate reductase family protein [Flavobacterium sp. JAS]|uniref:dihydrofolate reductase family protein n=1 Tax=Flavobacterium sp. JAS TaxID=2897329 RepID=UPI001E4D911C|nr:dihydrofolate reductase [Flavobacterium sp. JAS]MCD0470355.1 dihydrofolate reductase [Flavobacterium sp. JAS]